MDPFAYSINQDPYKAALQPNLYGNNFRGQPSFSNGNNNTDNHGFFHRLKGKLPTIAPAIGGLLGGLFSDSDPYGVYMSGIGQIPDAFQKDLQPFMDAGNRALPGLEEQFSQQIDHPDQILSRLGSGFRKSPGYQFRVNEATDAANRMASASGNLGSPAEQEALASRIGSMADQDYNDFLTKMMRLYGAGIQGESGLENQGFKSAQTLANVRAKVLAAQAEAAAKAEESKDNVFSDIGQVIGTIFS